MTKQEWSFWAGVGIFLGTASVAVALSIGAFIKGDLGMVGRGLVCLCGCCLAAYVVWRTGKGLAWKP